MRHVTCSTVFYHQVSVGQEPVWLVDLTVAQNDGSILDIGKEVREKCEIFSTVTHKERNIDVASLLIKNTAKKVFKLIILGY